MTDSFPRQRARTVRFTLGVPRSFHVSSDGQRIVFLRSKNGTDPVTCLWVLDLGSGRAAERLVVDPVTLGGSADEPSEERARRERSREAAGGVVAFATDAATEMATFALAGRVYVTSLAAGGGARAVGAAEPAIDPRPDPGGQRIAYVCNGALRIADLASGSDAELIGPRPGQRGSEADVSYGLAEFVAAEEMRRFRGYWWSPDGSALLVARVDNAAVQHWHIADGAHPERPATEIRYPSAGTANADVSLLVVGLDGSAVPVRWDSAAFPYLAFASWDAEGPLLVVQSRDQKEMRLLAADPATGETRCLRADSDADWIDIVPGVPARLDDGRIAWTAEAGDARRLLVATAGELSSGTAEPVTPAGMQVREILSVDGDTVLFAASEEEPAEIGIWAYTGGGHLARVSAEGGVSRAVRAGGTTVLSRRSMDGPGVEVTVLRAGSPVTAIESVAEQPKITPRVTFLRAGQRELRTALLLPAWYHPGDGGPALPVLMDPYGGPHAQRVLAEQDAYLASQWFADQGFAVIVADGRGVPGRGSAWDRAIAGDFAGPTVEDQADALVSVAEQCARDGLAALDLGKVGIRGWSFGGYLAALAVLRRPDVFHAGVAGAPVTEWRMYDTHYTERYLGDPRTAPEVYDNSSLIPGAGKLSRPLMIIHGLADDNVVVAHSLRLSSALLAAGRPHTFLPLPGVTHMATQEEVAQNLLLLQVDFLKQALGVGA
jgi:dipeptidyl-peptidase-4